MTITLLEAPVSRDRVRRTGGSATLPGPVWVEPARPVTRPRRAVVISLHPVSPVVAHPPVRLTRRGRLALTLATVACGLVVTALAQSSAAATDAGRTPASATSVVVGPGDTLWAIAVRAEPDADPRVTVARLVALNRLSGAQIRPGQRLILPAD